MAMDVIIGAFSSPAGVADRPSIVGRALKLSARRLDSDGVGPPAEGQTPRPGAGHAAHVLPVEPLDCLHRETSRPKGVTEHLQTRVDARAGAIQCLGIE